MRINLKKLKAIFKSLKNGATINAACRAADIEKSTLWRWRKAIPKLDARIKEIIDNRIQTVEDALYKRAIGYSYRETTIERSALNPKIKIKKVVVKEITADVTAQMFFLMNRAPERWADKRALVHNTIVNKNTNISPVKTAKDEELDVIIARARG